MMKKKLPVSLVIPCYNRPVQTEALLRSLKDAAFECEIIVIDDCSNEDLSTIVNKFNELNITYHRNQQNSGPSYSRNKGIELAGHDLIAFTDNDCIVTSDWLIRLHEYITNAKSNVAAVGGRVLPKNNDLVSQYYTYHKILDPWYHRGRYYYVVTANAIFKRAALIQVDGFDTLIRKAGGEDPGLCFKLMKNGWDFLYNPDAVIVHDYQKELKRLFNTFFRYGFGCSVQARKYYSKPEYIEASNFGGLTIESIDRGDESYVVSNH